MAYRRNIALIEQNDLIGRLSECVFNGAGECVVICGDDGDLAQKITDLLNRDMGSDNIEYLEKV